MDALTTLKPPFSPWIKSKSLENLYTANLNAYTQMYHHCNWKGMTVINHKLNNRLLLLCVFIIVIPIVTHLTPRLALRTHLFTSGYLSNALFSEITIDESVNKADYGLIFDVSPSPYEKQTGTILDKFIVEKELFYYVSHYYPGN